MTRMCCSRLICAGLERNRRGHPRLRFICLSAAQIPIMGNGREEDMMREEEKQERFRSHLLRWYAQEGRRLPWREHITPYRTWVSEIMLQQTRVEAVIPYFERFITTFPSLRDLAEADDDLLHKMWEGLGYYSRVRNMKKCAQVCVERHDGELPHTRDALLELPGIGPYTAGAIASIACNERVCAVDGNVLRVFSRILCSEEDISAASAKKNIEQSMTAYLPDAAQISAFNQALMDLGAMVCLPKGEPRCAQCPVQTECAAFACGMQMQLPVRTAKKPRRIEEHTVLIYACQQRLRLIRRPSKGLLSGLYGFEMTEERLSEEAVKQAHPDERVVALRPSCPCVHPCGMAYGCVPNSRQRRLMRRITARRRSIAAMRCRRPFGPFIRQPFAV